MEMDGITIELPGANGQNQGESLTEILDLCRQTFAKVARSASKELGGVTRDAQSSFGIWEKLLEKLTTKTLKQTSSGLKRAVLGFDELNRLTRNTGTGTVVKENEKLKESLLKLAEDMGIVGQNLKEDILNPVTEWGSQTVTNLFGKLKDAFTGGLFGDRSDLQEYNRLFNGLNYETRTWNALTGDSYVVGNAFTEMLEKTGHRAQMASLLMQGMGTEVSGVSGQLSSMGNSAQIGWDGVTRNFGQANKWFTVSVTDPVRTSFSGLWAEVQTGAQESWTGTKGIFSDAGSFFEKTFSNAWGRVKAVFSDDGQVYSSLQEGILASFKKSANGLIDGINRVVARPFTGLNQVLSNIQKVKIGTLQPFASLSWRAEVPKIPYLAKGAVLPANKPFLAVVGDLRHGTNVEAPLSTIQAAVAAVMQEHTDANMPGHSATVQVLRQILEGVLGIRISDETIACAYDRYQHQLGIVNGR